MTNYLNGFRNIEASKELGLEIMQLAEQLDRPHCIMEVCGSHTMSIARFGIKQLLPKSIRLVSGPGCPVCVTDPGTVDAAVKLAEEGKLIATFGDMLHVPGSETTLEACRAKGARIHVCYSPINAIELAQHHPDQEVVFLAIGFETTMGPVVSIIDKAIGQGLNNISLLTAFKLVPPALDALIADPDLSVDAFLCPAHVSAVIGSRAYLPYVEKYAIPCVVAGFEPLDILYGIKGITEQLVAHKAEVVNQYSRVVKPDGNRKAQDFINQYLVATDASWRGMGIIKQSGMRIRDAYQQYDAANKFNLDVKPGKIPTGCKCGEVIKGKLSPEDCPLFGAGCTPDNAIGPCMVSSEGSCAAAYKYARLI